MAGIFALRYITRRWLGKDAKEFQDDMNMRSLKMFTMERGDLACLVIKSVDGFESRTHKNSNLNYGWQNQIIMLGLFIMIWICLCLEEVFTTSSDQIVTARPWPKSEGKLTNYGWSRISHYGAWPGDKNMFIIEQKLVSTILAKCRKPRENFSMARLRVVDAMGFVLFNKDCHRLDYLSDFPQMKSVLIRFWYIEHLTPTNRIPT